jgi:hypothetical protein
MSYFPHIAVWRIGEAILIIQAPTHHAAAVGYKCIQGMKESASLIDRPALAAEEWTSVAVGRQFIRGVKERASFDGPALAAHEWASK